MVNESDLMERLMKYNDELDSCIKTFEDKMRRDRENLKTSDKYLKGRAQERFNADYNKLESYYHVRRMLYDAFPQLDKEKKNDGRLRIA